MTMTALTRTTSSGIVDMVAVARFAAGADVALTPEERRVAIHTMSAAGYSKSHIARRFRVHDSKITAELAQPQPVDAFGIPFTLNL